MSHIAAERTATIDTPPPSLIGPGDPPLLDRIEPDGPTPVLLLADHAGNAVPRGLDRLGVEADVLARHVAYDIGAAALTRALAGRLGAAALLHRYSRLLIDPNRPLDDPTSICAISDRAVVPGNRGLTAEQRARRAATFFVPYHRAIEQRLDAWLDAGALPAVVAVHSFTPALRGFPRPWHVGVLWAEDGRIARPLIDALGRDPTLCVGDNQPYDGRNRHGYTVETHALARGLPHVLIEVRQDLIAEVAGQRAWADRLADALAPILAAVARPPAGAG